MCVQFVKKGNQNMKVLQVTGAGRGLGQGLALALAKEGCSLAVVDINIADAEDTAKKIQDEGGKAKVGQTAYANY